MKNNNQKRVVGFYRDERGRTRPITEPGKTESKKKIVPSRKFATVKPKAKAAEDKRARMLEDALQEVQVMQNELSSL
jgi:hypothetical protein